MMMSPNAPPNPLLIFRGHSRSQAPKTSDGKGIHAGPCTPVR